MIKANTANFLSDFYAHKNYKKEIKRIKKSIKDEAKTGSKYLCIYFNDDYYYMYSNIYSFLEQLGYNVTLTDMQDHTYKLEIDWNYNKIDRRKNNGSKRLSKD